MNAYIHVSGLLNPNIYFAAHALYIRIWMEGRGLNSDTTERSPLGVPQWIESALHLTAGRDPIGLQTISNDRILPRLVPSILALSRRARYFSYYPFLLLEYERHQLPPTNRALSDFIKAREYEFALAVQHCPNCRTLASAVVGKQRAAPAAAYGGDPLPRGESIESYLGGYGIYYRTPLIELGLVAPPGTQHTGEEITPIDTLMPGISRKLADSFREAIEGTQYYREYMDGDEPIPRSVYEELAKVSCLCRLTDFPEEQALIREALFSDSPVQPPEDVDQRRRSFALLLWLSEKAPGAVDSDTGFRQAIWSAFRQQHQQKFRLNETLAQWAALVAKEYMQEGLSTIWSATCREGRRRQGPDGMNNDEFERMLREELTGSGVIDLSGQAILFNGQMSTEAFADAVIDASQNKELEDLRAALTAADTAIAGLTLLLIVRERLPQPDLVSPGWVRVGVLGSTWQPGLLPFAQQIDVHLESKPTLADTMAWLVRQRIVTVHQRVAYSKLNTGFTFRFRWENDRLRFYHHFAARRFDLTDMRQVAMARISEDIGLWQCLTDGTPQLSDIGLRFVDEVIA